MDWRMRGTSAMSTPVPRIMKVRLQATGSRHQSSSQWSVDGGQCSVISVLVSLLEEEVAPIEELTIDQASFTREAVRTGGTFCVDVEYLVPVCNKPVGNEHAMALEV